MKNKKRSSGGDFTARVEETIRKYNLLRPRDRVLAAVSGGADSLSLLLALVDLIGRWELELAVAHFNHGLRKEARSEARWVEEKAKTLGLPFIYMEAGAEIKEKDGSSLQERARRLRYRFFQKAAGEGKFNRVALGHNADDQVETVLLRVIEGKGRSGWAGIPPRRPLGDQASGIEIVRPLLERTRGEITAYLKDKGWEWLEDRSNASFAYLRNRIRHKVLPVIREEINARVESTVLQVTEVLRDEEQLLDRLAGEALENCRIPGEQGLVLAVEKVLGLEPALRRRLLRRVYHQAGEDLPPLGFSNVRELESLLEEGRPNRWVSLPAGVRAERSYEKLEIIFPDPDPGSSDDINRKEETGVDGSGNWFEVPVPGETVIPLAGNNAGRLRFNFEIVPREEIKTFPDGREEAVLDWGKVKTPLAIRRPRTGDSFHPLGAPGMKKLKKFFIENRVPVSRRREAALLVAGDDIIWIVGSRIDQRYRVTAETREVLRVKVTRDDV